MATDKRIKYAFTIYWFLLFYIIAALIWWFISLELSNKELYQFAITQTEQKFVVNKDTTSFISEKKEHLQLKKRRTTKHISEGLTFLLVISIGAMYIYNLVKKQLKINKQQQNFIMAVTHELKTPIAIAKLNIQTLQKRKLEEPQHQQLLTHTITELNRLNDLASNILIVSQIDSGDYKMNKQPINLSNVLLQLIAQQQTQNTQITIHQQIEPNCTIFADELLITLTFSNILNNAIKYSDKNCIINIQCFYQNNKILVKCSDNGIGVKPTEASKIFDKFYRSEDELIRSKKGTGLGLYLCKKILNDHLATIEYTNNTPKGSIFTVSFNKYAT